MSAAAFAGLIAIADQGITESGFDSLTATNYGGDTPLTAAKPSLHFMALVARHPMIITTSRLGSTVIPGPGYDMVTGLGSPVANQLVPIWPGPARWGRRGTETSSTRHGLESGSLYLAAPLSRHP